MRNKDTKSIAYLFKEMDPSEEVEFERNIESNENLLIEVESLKQVNDRLKALPSFNPPDNVIKAVHQLAVNRSAKPKKNWQNPIYYAVAAVFMIGFTAGIFLIESGEADGASESAGFGTPVFQLPDASAISTSSESTADRKRVSPWVDNNEVIRFSDRIRHIETSSVDSVFKNSYQRLTPVTDPVQSGLYQRNLHLTGSRQ